MKKLLSFIFLLTLAACAMPLLTVGLGTPAAAETLPSESAALPSSLPQTTEAGSYDASATVTLCTGGETRELSLREYLIGVLAAEMPAGFPEEALRAQAIAARTYTLYKMNLYADQSALPESHHGASLCDDPAHCEAFSDLAVSAAALWGDSAQVYRSRLEAAVDGTDGKILVYDGQPIAAVFCSAAGPKTENAADVWGTEIPYLVSVDSPGGEDCSRYRDTVTIAQSDFAAAVRKTYPKANLSGDPAAWFWGSNRTASGCVKDVLLGGVRVSGSFVRQAAGLNSANFTVQVSGSDLVFSTIGCGHGVGMSQYGARYLALDGKSCEEILAHYYPGTQLLLKS